MISRKPLKLHEVDAEKAEILAKTLPKPLCKSCGFAQIATEFIYTMRKRDGRRKHKRCHTCWKKVTQFSNRSNILRKYNMTCQEYLDKIEKQGGCCEICGCPDNGDRSLAVDHDHNTGQVRGLLCGKCNGGIGLLKDNAGLLRKAINYLRKYRK